MKRTARRHTHAATLNSQIGLVIMIAALPAIFMTIAALPFTCAALDDSGKQLQITAQPDGKNGNSDTPPAQETAGTPCANCGKVLSSTEAVCPNCGSPNASGASTEDPQDFDVLEISKKQVHLAFKGFTTADMDTQVSDPPGACIVHINWGRDTETLFLYLGESHHGYTVGGVDKKAKSFWDGTGERLSVISTWFLTLARNGADPVVLELNTEKLIEEDYAIIQIQGPKDQPPCKKEVYEGDIFSAGGNTYQVAGISGEGVLVVALVDNPQTALGNQDT